MQRVMDSATVKNALGGQYHAGFAMLRQAIEACSPTLWVAGAHPRSFWRIAYHVLFYTHLYLMTEEAAFRCWSKHRDTVTSLWPEDKPPILEPYSKQEVLEYLNWIDANVDNWLELIDLDSPRSGFNWYKCSKLDHQLMNIRHLGTHVGQLSELIMADPAVEIDWVSVGSQPGG